MDSGIVVIQQAFHAFGIDSAFANLTPSSTRPIEVNLDDADIATTGDVLSAMTHCIFIPINAHLVLVMPDDGAHRSQFDQAATETIKIPNLEPGNAQERTDVEGILGTVFGITKFTLHENTVTVHATKRELVEIAGTLTSLFQPPPQILLEVKAYIVSHGHDRDLGVQTPQQVKVFNIDSEAESLITSNASIVEELISSGAVSAGNTLGIAEALIAEGYGGNSVLSSPFVYFGGGKTATGVQFGSVDANASLSVSSSEQLQSAILHLESGHSGTLKIGQHYPILTATTMALGGKTSSATPTIQYEDIGLLLEANPRELSAGDVLLHLHETFRSLAGTRLNNIPIIDNREFVTDLSVPAGVTTVVVSNLSSTETRTAQGLIDLVPTNSERDLQSSDLVITITPFLSRSAIDGAL